MRAYPGQYNLLALAAIAALVEERPDRAQLYFKRLKKQFLLGQEYLMRPPLTLDQHKRRPAALELLRLNHPDHHINAKHAFPAGVCLAGWLAGWPNA